MRYAPLLLLAALPAAADIRPGPLAAGANVGPDGPVTEIALVREEVVIDVHDRFAIVDATFELKNTGKATELPCGFPGEGTTAGRAFAILRPLVGFAVFLDGKAADTTTLDRGGTWHMFRLALAEGARCEVRVRYGIVADGTAADRSVWYVLATGAGWKGPIGEAVVRVRARGKVDPATVRVRDDRMPFPSPPLPEYGSRKDGEVVLVRKDFEPTSADDLQVSFKSGEGAGNPDDKETTREIERALFDPTVLIGSWGGAQGGRDIGAGVKLDEMTMDVTRVAGTYEAAVAMSLTIPTGGGMTVLLEFRHTGGRAVDGALRFEKTPWHRTVPSTGQRDDIEGNPLVLTPGALGSLDGILEGDDGMSFHLERKK